MNDACRTEDRESADDAEPPVPCFGCDGFPTRNRYFNLHIGRNCMLGSDVFDFLDHHLPRHGIDRRLAWRKGQARLGDGANAFPALKLTPDRQPDAPSRRSSRRG